MTFFGGRDSLCHDDSVPHPILVRSFWVSIVVTVRTVFCGESGLGPFETLARIKCRQEASRTRGEIEDTQLSCF